MEHVHERKAIVNNTRIAQSRRYAGAGARGGDGTAQFHHHFPVAAAVRGDHHFLYHPRTNSAHRSGQAAAAERGYPHRRFLLVHAGFPVFPALVHPLAALFVFATGVPLPRRAGARNGHGYQKPSAPQPRQPAVPALAGGTARWLHEFFDEGNITVVSLIVWPVWTFWWLQAAFLPYHDNTIVWWQRVFLLLDATLLAYLWAKILDDQDDAGRWWKPWLAPLCYDLAKPFKAMLGWLCRQSVLPQRLHRVLIRLNISLGIQGNNGANPDYPATLKMVSTRWLLAVFLFIALFFSFVVSTVPYSWEDKLWKTMLLFLDSRIDPDIEKFPAVANNTRRIFPLTNWLHEQRKVYLQDNERNDYDPKRLRECGDEKTAEKQSQSDKEPKCYSVDGFFPRNLILNERVLAANQDLPAELLSQLDAKNDKTAPDALAKIQGLDLRRRHLEYADFSQSSLPNADLRSARLDVANFSSAKLEKARLENAEMSGANLNDAKLPGADLKGAQFRTANLSKALLTGADLSDAQFPEADMSDAQLQRTKLRNAQLPNANLSKAVLTSSDLGYVNLQRANLSRAQLYNANLSGAILVEADLSNAELSGSDLSSANLSGADLRCAGFQGANLSYAMLLGADINGFIGFIPSDFSGADLSGANLSDANLRSADLSGADTQI